MDEKDMMGLLAKPKQTKVSDAEIAIACERVYARLAEREATRRELKYWAANLVEKLPYSVDEFLARLVADGRVEQYREAKGFEAYRIVPEIDPALADDDAATLEDRLDAALDEPSDEELAAIEEEEKEMAEQEQEQEQEVKEEEEEEQATEEAPVVAPIAEEPPATAEPADEWISQAEAARLTGIPVHRVRDWAATGKIQSKKSGPHQSAPRLVKLAEVSAVEKPQLDQIVKLAPPDSAPTPPAKVAKPAKSPQPKAKPARPAKRTKSAEEPIPFRVAPPPTDDVRLAVEVWRRGWLTAEQAMEKVAEASK